jgi:hypothetical protein
MARQLGGRMTSNQIKRLSNDAIDKVLTNNIVATKALAHKLARASYWMQVGTNALLGRQCRQGDAPVGPMLDPDGCLARSAMRT